MGVKYSLFVFLLNDLKQKIAFLHLKAEKSTEIINFTISWYCGICRFHSSMKFVFLEKITFYRYLSLLTKHVFFVLFISICNKFNASKEPKKRLIYLFLIFIFFMFSWGIEAVKYICGDYMLNLQITLISFQLGPKLQFCNSSKCVLFQIQYIFF